MCYGDATVFNTIDLFEDILIADPVKSFNTAVDRDLQTSLGTDFVPGPFDVVRSASRFLREFALLKGFSLTHLSASRYLTDLPPR